MMSSYRRHLVACPECGKDVLDHMRECPFCHAKLTPLTGGAWPEEKVRRIRKQLNIIGFVIAAAFLLWRLLR